MNNRLVVIACCCMLAPAEANAENAVVVAQAGGDGFFENLDPLPKVSTTPLAGLQIGAPRGGKTVLDNVVVAFPKTELGRICVRASTRDGRYHADNPYFLPNDSEATQGVVGLSPLSVDYRNELSEYDARDFVLAARLSEETNCLGTDGVYLPKIVDPNGKLELMVNSRGRDTEARLGAGDALGACRKIDRGSNIAFDTLCSIELRERGNVKMTLGLDDGFGKLQYDYVVYIPAAQP